MILDDIKNFLVENDIIQNNKVKYDFDSSNGDEILLLQLYDNRPCDNARRSGIKLIHKFFDLEHARQTAFVVHDLFFPEDGFQKSLNVNGKIMHAKLNNGPCYQGKDASKRHNYILDITLTYNR